MKQGRIDWADVVASLLVFAVLGIVALGAFTGVLALATVIVASTLRGIGVLP